MELDRLLILDDAEENLQNVFCAERLEIPEPPVEWKRKIKTFEKTNLSNQHEAAIFDMRCWQANKLGFVEYSLSEFVEMLMGVKHTEIKESGTRHNHEWVFFHNSGKILIGDDCNWGSDIDHYIRKVKKNPWFLPPFWKQIVWDCVFGCIDYVRFGMPVELALRIERLRELQLFNCFSVVGPHCAFSSVGGECDALIVTADIWELPGSEPSKAGKIKRYYLGRWDVKNEF